MTAELSVRLKAVYDMCDMSTGDRLIDVGSDHGYLALHALRTGDFRKVVCTDIHKDPAKRTKACLTGEGYERESEVYCTDGLDGVKLQENDVIVMAGLGGNNITDIMARAIEATPSDIMSTIIWCLQPQKSIEVLRAFLADNGFALLDEKVVNDRGIYYPMLKAEFNGQKYSLTPRMKFYGPILTERSKRGEAVVKEFFLRLDDRYRLRARGDIEVKRMMEDSI